MDMPVSWLEFKYNPTREVMLLRRGTVPVRALEPKFSIASVFGSGGIEPDSALPPKPSQTRDFMSLIVDGIEPCNRFETRSRKVIIVSMAS